MKCAGFRLFLRVVPLSAILAWGSSGAGVTTELPYPEGQPTAKEIIEQVYFVNHFYALKNFAIVKKGRKITVLVSRAKGKRPTTNTLERFPSSVPASCAEQASSSPTTTTTTRASPMSSALRKTRRFAQPAQDDSWGGLDFTFGDVVLRKPKDETHEYLGKEIFESCLEGMDIPKKHRNRYTRHLPKNSCTSKGKEVYKVKSTTKFENWWYDYRISYVDTRTFADYRTEYYKNGKKIKFIDRDWRSLNLDDPRALAWGYWYGKNFETVGEDLAQDKALNKCSVDALGVAGGMEVSTLSRESQEKHDDKEENCHQPGCNRPGCSFRRHCCRWCSQGSALSVVRRPDGG